MFIQSPILSAVGFTDWQCLDYRQRPFDVWFRAIFTPTSAMTYNVEYTLDDPNAQPTYLKSCSRATTVITATTFSAHNLNVGDEVRIMWTGTAMDGIYNIASVPSTTTFTVTSATSGTIADTGKAAFIPCRVTVLTNYSALTAAKDGTLVAPVRAIRLNVTAYTSGSILLEALQGPSSA